MNTKRFLLAGLAAFVVISILEFVIHGMLLRGTYMATASVWRPEAEMMQRMWLFYPGYAIFALAFTFIYVKGFESGRGMLAQGARYGLYMGVLVGAMSSFGWYVVLPIPGMLAVYWFIASLAESVIAGAAVGSIYQD